MVNTVYAQPPLPSSFYGEIHITDGAPIVGDTINAYVPGVPGIAASTTVKSDAGKLVYNINIPGDIPDTALEKEGGIEGDVVTFKIGERIVATGTWHMGTNARLNFHPPEALPGTPSGVVGVAVDFSGSANDAASDVDKYEWDWNNDSTYDETGQNTTHTWSAVGTYTVGLKVTDLQKGVGTATVGVVIGKGTATVTLGDLAQTYDGTSKSASAITAPVGLTVAFTYDGFVTPPTDADSYVVVATVNDTNYEGTASDTLVIAKASSTTTVSGGGTYVYNSAARPASVSVTGAGGLSLTPAPAYSGACTTAPVNVADTPCTASYTYSGDTNHDGSSGTTTITITPAEATVTLSNLSHIYDGSAKSATVTTNPTSLAYTVTYNGSATAPTNAASYAVVATVNDTNYEGTASDTLVIAKASSTTTVSGGGTFVYNSAARPASVSVTGAGGLSLTPAPVYTGACTAAPVNVADTPCTASYTYTGDTNHDGSSGTTTITITPAEATVTLSNLSHIYDGSAKSATVTTNPTSLAYTVTYNGSATAPTNAASYAVVATVNDTNYEGIASDTLVIAKASSTTTVSGGGTYVYNSRCSSSQCICNRCRWIELDTSPGLFGCLHCSASNVADTPCTASYTYTGDTNHDGSSGTTTITITPAEATVTLSNLSHIYDGSAKSATVTTNPSGLANTVTYNGSTTEPSAAGSYAVIATITNPNYTGSATDTMVISAFHSIDLVPGWNLVSFSLHPTSTLVEDVLASVVGHYDLVYAWDATGAHSTGGNWMRADNNPAPTDTLLNLDETMGFWIHMTEADTLEVVGSVPGTSNISLATNAGGWNLVGYPSAGSGLLPGSLTAHSTMVYAFHAGDTGDPWKLHDTIGAPYANDLNSLTAGWGYWLYVTLAETWSIGY